MPEIVISSRAIAVSDLHKFMVADAGTRELGFELRQIPSGTRSQIDPTVLVAIVAGTSGAMSGLITGLLRFLERRQDRTGKVELHGADGTSVIVPVGTSKEDLQRLIGSPGPSTRRVSRFGKRMSRSLESGCKSAPAPFAAAAYNLVRMRNLRQVA